MAELSDDVLEEAAHRGETLLVEDLVSLAERAHDDEPGIERDRLTTYAEALAERRDVDFDLQAFDKGVADRLTDAETWTDRDRLYELGDGRLSLYPAEWHAALGGSTDVAEYIAFLERDAPEFVLDRGTAEVGPGIPQQKLLDIVAVVGRVDRETARAALADARDAGEVVEDADQHPQAGVYLRDEAETYRDGTLDG
ncbi:hypothetical protein ACFR9U_02335 [Halorientalis brevis]|uniref:Uncharacterized protein n=1 Tax=Halorientalis brevis TaxID=1126241 RepID=A0ABD6C952_9EURY|nr:hypothetical protein [Halorientalis brevis]